jgi:mono/diheme cytochrome c family protein
MFDGKATEAGLDLRWVTICLAWLVLMPGLLVAAGAEPPAVSSIPLPDNPLEGRVLFESNGCHQCHGLASDSTGIGPDLGARHFEGTFLELGAALWNHVPGMSVTFEVTGLAWPQLTSEEAMELIAFLYFIDYLGRPGVAESGEVVFAEQGCSSCHSVGGGEAHVGPDLAELESFASPLSVAQQIWNHGPSMLEGMRRLGMPPPSFEEGDLADLSAFVRQKAGPGPRERTLLAPGSPNRGTELFRTKGCATCHGTEGSGGQGGPDLTTAELRQPAEAIASTMWNHSLGMRDTMQQRGIGWPEFQDSELADLVAFLYFLPFRDSVGDSERGAEVFRDRSCDGCHGGAGVSETAPSGPELSGTGDPASPASMVAAMWNHAPVMKKAILGEGRPWPELTGRDLRDLRAYLLRETASP